MAFPEEKVEGIILMLFWTFRYSDARCSLILSNIRRSRKADKIRNVTMGVVLNAEVLQEEI